MEGVKILGHAWFTGAQGQGICIVVTDNGYEHKAKISQISGFSETIDIGYTAAYGGSFPLVAGKMVCGVPL